VVPTAAIQRGPSGTLLYVLRDNSTVAVRPVTLSQQDDVQSVVDSGLQAGERVVTTGFARLTEGTAVTVSSAEDTGQATPADRPHPEGARGGRAAQKRNPGAAARPTANP
jgi:membrane fusion protein, multidrug efflux system